MKRLTYAGLAIGLAVLATLLAWRGIGEVGGILLSSGWELLVLPLVWAPMLLLTAMAWRVIFAPGTAPPYSRLLIATWIGRAVNNLLPVAQIGGEVVRARLISIWGARAVDATATVVADKTVQAMSSIIWGLIGVALLIALSLDDGLLGPALAGLAVLGGCVAAFLVVQRAGMFGAFARAAGAVGKGAFWDGMIERAREVDRCLRGVYGRPGRVVLAVMWRSAALMVQTGEVWLAAHLLGHPIGIAEAMMLKSLASTLSDIAFVVPNSYGVQEGAYVVLGGLLGLSPEFMLALSLATRIREVVIDVPGLFAWQHVEGRHFFRRRLKGQGSALP